MFLPYIQAICRWKCIFKNTAGERLRSGMWPLAEALWRISRRVWRAGDQARVWRETVKSLPCGLVACSLAFLLTRLTDNFQLPASSALSTCGHRRNFCQDSHSRNCLPKYSPHRTSRAYDSYRQFHGFDVFFGSCRRILRHILTNLLFTWSSIIRRQLIKSESIKTEGNEVGRMYVFFLFQTFPCDTFVMRRDCGVTSTSFCTDVRVNIA